MGLEQIEIIEYIKRLDDKELRNFVEERIEFLEEDEYGMYPDTIGYVVDYNPESTILTKENENTIADTILRNNYMGYISYGTRIVYGIATDKEGLVKTNLGRYYYIDDDDYIFGFCKSIRDKEITDIYMFFDLIFNYIQDYFGIIEQIDRDKMTNLILKKEYHFFDPIYENRLSMFKKKGNAQCSEIALAAQNILSFFAIESNYITQHKNFIKDSKKCPKSKLFAFRAVGSRKTANRASSPSTKAPRSSTKRPMTWPICST